MKILVIDGQGGGIGRALVEKVTEKFHDGHEVIALGTNSMATSSMIKAGAHKGATGENAIIVNCREADIIFGVIGIISPNSMMGELTPKMAEAISSCNAKKILIPIEKCGIEIAGTDRSLSVQKLIQEAVSRITSF